ncbi:hypothetical protein TNCV_2193451 [Trichonephila clavipes]|nr:hypothetical protein TNCV_2193451 [Trichonephila clavipes]
MERRNDGGTCAASRCSVQDTLNQYNAHMWASENSHRTQSRADQQRFSVNVRDCILGDYLIAPYLLPSPLDDSSYLTFLQQVAVSVLLLFFASQLATTTFATLQSYVIPNFLRYPAPVSSTQPASLSV